MMHQLPQRDLEPEEVLELRENSPTCSLQVLRKQKTLIQNAPRCIAFDQLGVLIMVIVADVEYSPCVHAIVQQQVQSKRFVKSIVFGDIPYRDSVN